MNKDDDRLADALNSEPIVFMDCTPSQLMTSCIVGVPSGAVLGLLIGFPLGSFIIGIIVFLIGYVGTLFGLLYWISSTREKYHDNWLKENVFLINRQYGFSSGKFINKSQRFSKEGRRRG